MEEVRKGKKGKRKVNIHIQYINIVFRALISR